MTELLGISLWLILQPRIYLTFRASSSRLGRESITVEFVD